MTAYERYQVRKALKVEIGREESDDLLHPVKYVIRTSPRMEREIEKLAVLGAYRFALLKRINAAGDNAVPKHNGGNGQ